MKYSTPNARLSVITDSEFLFFQSSSFSFFFLLARDDILSRKEEEEFHMKQNGTIIKYASTRNEGKKTKNKISFDTAEDGESELSSRRMNEFVIRRVYRIELLA